MSPLLALMAGLSAVSLMQEGLRRRNQEAVALAMLAAAAMLALIAR